jgi:hypothetical protein
MIKVFLILLFLNLKSLFADQTLLVLSDGFNSSNAILYSFENGVSIFPPIDVNIGRNGLAWDSEDKEFEHKNSEPLKHEGDGKSPAGIFALVSSFGTDEQTFHFPYTKSSSELICVDDTNSSLYNTLVLLPPVKPKSFEYMKRDDNQYDLGIIVAYNPTQIKNNGSCIFLHVEKEALHPTAGCTSMQYNEIKKIITWLDSSKNPRLVQIPIDSFTSKIAKRLGLPYFKVK